jgi:hypothetical protein
MPAGPHAEFSFLTLLVLMCVLGLSCLTFWLLVRRATSHRTWVALSDWARNRGFRYHPIRRGGSGGGAPGAGGEPPAPFSSMPAARPTVRLWLQGKDAQLLQLQPPEAAAVQPVAAPATAGGAAVPSPPTWHALVRQVESPWPPTALRPAAREETLLDLFSLASYPSMIASERFVIFGTDSAAARSLAKSSMPALLPPDVGLLLHGQSLVLDFSSRPFDTIEFDRMLALANHLTAHLPALTG